MPANNSPIFSRLADIQWISKVSAANTGSDITAGTSYLVFTSDATNGGFLQKVVVKTEPGANTAATVVRFWVNNGSTTATLANSILAGEITMPATTASSVAAQTEGVWSANIALPAGYKIYATIGTAPGANAAYDITAYGGKY
jgi:hypothetical protein